MITLRITSFEWTQRQLSDKNQVTLENLNLNSAGQYRCEISAEAPLFNTVAQSKKLNVIGTFNVKLVTELFAPGTRSCKIWGYCNAVDPTNVKHLIAVNNKDDNS